MQFSPAAIRTLKRAGLTPATYLDKIDELLFVRNQRVMYTIDDDVCVGTIATDMIYHDAPRVPIIRRNEYDVPLCVDRVDGRDIVAIDRARDHIDDIERYRAQIESHRA